MKRGENYDLLHRSNDPYRTYDNRHVVSRPALFGIYQNAKIMVSDHFYIDNALYRCGVCRSLRVLQAVVCAPSYRYHNITVFRCPSFGLLFSGALGLKYQSGICIAFFALNFIIEVACALSGSVFYFNDEGHFRGSLFFIYELFYFVSLIYLIVCISLAGKKFRHRDTVTICMILIILVAGLLPMTVFKLNITYLAIGISASICYIYYNGLVQQDIQAELVVNQEKCKVISFRPAARDRFS